MSESTSYGLLSRMRKDSGIPWEDFHRRYHDLLVFYGQVNGLVGNELEELVNDVLFELFHHDKRSLFRYDPARGRFRNYLKVIANRTAVDLLRRRTPSGKPPFEVLPVELEQRETAERDKIILAEVLQELKFRCNPQHVQIFVQYMLQERAAAEIGREFDLSIARACRHKIVSQ